MKFVFTCGGTAGHINPALAVASSICERLPDSDILFIGAEGQMECDLVPRAGYTLRTVRISNLSRAKSLEGIRHNVGTVKNVLTSVHSARQILKDFQPDVVIGTGGYVCYPVIRAAHELHVPTVVHESNAVPGLTTKMLSAFADRILVGVESAVNEYHKHEKVVVTGTPVRSGFDAFTKEEAKKVLSVGSEYLVASVWGSLGAGHMNGLMLDLIPQLSKDTGVTIYHATGKRYYENFMKQLTSSCPDYEERGLRVFAYIHDMPTVMSAADLVLCRSGASTLSELTYMGKPAILIPSPNVTGNHQEKNARVLERSGAARVFLESELSSARLLEEILHLVKDRETLRRMSDASRTLCVPDSVSKITDIILSLT